MTRLPFCMRWDLHKGWTENRGQRKIVEVRWITLDGTQVVVYDYPVTFCHFMFEFT